jgi:hypothetical protein
MEELNINNDAAKDLLKEHKSVRKSLEKKK